jgi:hypothetical protein
MSLALWIVTGRLAAAFVTIASLIRWVERYSCSWV